MISSLSIIHKGLNINVSDTLAITLIDSGVCEATWPQSFPQETPTNPSILHIPAG